MRGGLEERRWRGIILESTCCFVRVAIFSECFFGARTGALFVDGTRVELCRVLKCGHECGSARIFMVVRLRRGGNTTVHGLLRPMLARMTPAWATRAMQSRVALSSLS